MMKHIASSNSMSSISKLTDEQIQPNAIDVSVDRIFKIDNSSLFEISEEIKNHRKTNEVVPVEDVYTLEEGSYEVIMQGEISIAEGEAGWLIARSTLNRNGIYITSGLYDSNYKGVLAGVLHTNGPIKVKKGTRIAQFLLFNAETDHLYNGSYGKNSKSDNERYFNVEDQK